MARRVLIPELEKTIAKELGLGVREAHMLSMLFIKTIKNLVADGNNVVIQGFGTFKAKKIKGRKKSIFGVERMIPTQHKVVFVSSPAWSRKLIQNKNLGKK